MEPFSQATVFKARHVLDGAIAPTQSYVVFCVSETVAGTTPDDDVQRTALWRVATDGGPARRLTSNRTNASSPRFGTDPGHVYFLSARDPEAKDNQVHAMPMDGGEAEAITSIDGGVALFAVSPDGTRLACVATGVPRTTRKPGEHVRIVRTAYRFDPVPGYLEDSRQSLFVVDFATRTVERLTDADGLITAVAWAPDSRRIAIVRQMGQASDLFGHADLCVVASGEAQRTLLARGLVQLPFWSADGRHVGFCRPCDDDLGRQSRLWTVPAEGGAPMLRTATIDCSFPGWFQVDSPAARSASVALASGDSVVIMMGVGGEGRLVRVALTGEERVDTIVTGPRVCRLLDQRGGRILYTSQDWNAPTELRWADMDGGRDACLADPNAEWHGSVLWPTVEHLVVPSRDGTPIEAWLLFPQDRPAPHTTLLYIHGGPHASWGCAYGEDIHELVGAGYAVVLVNPRGSAGYGDAFVSGIQGRWGEIELDDFHAVLDRLVERGLVDEARIGVMGVSGGGHLSACLITHSNRFFAAVPEQGVYNMFSMYGVADCGAVLVGREMGGKPHERPELYWRLSPVAHAHRCRTPTLLIQGEDDVRCPIEQADEFYIALREGGCPVEFLRLGACAHGTQMAGPPPLRRFRMDAIKEWFERHLPSTGR